MCRALWENKRERWGVRERRVREERGKCEGQCKGIPLLVHIFPGLPYLTPLLLPRTEEVREEGARQAGEKCKARNKGTNKVEKV